MSFLAPWFLLGALAIGLPIVFHLMRRKPRARQVFSSLMFLGPSAPRVAERSRVDQLLLLILRCLIILILALAFARPFLPRSVEARAEGEGGRIVLVLSDTSASMRVDDLWAQARDRLDEVMRAIDPGDRVAWWAFDRGVRPVVDFDEWARPAGERYAEVRQRWDNLEPGWSATHLGEALLGAVERMREEAESSEAFSGDEAELELVVISDFQEGSRLDGLQGYDWPARVRVIPKEIGPSDPTNAGVRWLSRREGGIGMGSGSPDSLTVGVLNAQGSRRDRFALRWDDGDNEADPSPVQEMHVPPGEYRIASIDWPGRKPGRGHRLVLEEDGAPFDNRLYVAEPEPIETTVLYWGRSDPGDPAGSYYYLQQALDEEGPEGYPVRLEPLDADGAATAEGSDQSFTIIVDSLPAPMIARIRPSIRQGRDVLLVLRHPDMAATLAGLLDREGLRLEEVRPADYGLFGWIDFEAPLFAPFADPRFSDFTKIHFWRYRRLDPEAIPRARVLARFDSGDPAVVEVPQGEGTVWIWTSSWEPADSQLARSSKFVPLIYSLLEVSGSIRDQARQFYVGSPVPPDRRRGEGPVRVRHPDGAESSWEKGSFTATHQPGLYEVDGGDWRDLFAVNVAPRESRTDPLEMDRLENLGVPFDPEHESVDERVLAARADHQEYLEARELERHQKMWRWLIALALGLVVVETWLAGRFAPPRPSKT